MLITLEVLKANVLVENIDIEVEKDTPHNIAKQIYPDYFSLAEKYADDLDAFIYVFVEGEKIDFENNILTELEHMDLDLLSMTPNEGLTPNS